MISSSPAKKPEAGSMELGGSLFNSTSWLEFFGPGVVAVDCVVVLPLEVVVDVMELLVLEDVELVVEGPEVDRK